MKKATILLISIVICNFSFCIDSNVFSTLKGAVVQEILGDSLVKTDLLQQFGKKVVIIEFWEHWCGPCLQSMPHLKLLKEKYPDDLAIIAISSDDISKTRYRINELSCPFTYIYDKNKLISKVFPYTGIPHSVLVDREGTVFANTRPFYLTDSIIARVVKGKEVDVIEVPAFVPENIVNTVDSNTLVRFNLSLYHVGDHNFKSKSISQEHARFQTNLFSSELKDTIVNRMNLSIAGMNILGLYQIGFNDIPDNRILFSEDLKYIQSEAPKDCFRLDFSCSELLGNMNRQLINQLNGVFGLTDQLVQKKVPVLILKDVRLNDSTIKISKSPQNVYQSNISSWNFDLQSGAISYNDLSLVLERKLKMPVILDIQHPMMLDIQLKLNLKSTNVDDWIDLFKKNGIVLVKQMREVEFIEIRKTNSR
jgi:thiol-disulfide isomerase/thioredoxin